MALVLQQNLLDLVHERLRSQRKEFFSRGIRALPKRWNTCMEGNGDYIEK